MCECDNCKKQFDLDKGGHQDSEGGALCEPCLSSYMKEVERLYGITHVSQLEPSDDDCGYDLDDPKHPRFLDNALSVADNFRKSNREGA